jgi:hypothetical protein
MPPASHAEEKPFPELLVQGLHDPQGLLVQGLCL